MDLLGRVVRVGHKRYRVTAKIGSWGPNLVFPVFSCERHPPRLALIRPTIILKVQRRIHGVGSQFWTSVGEEAAQVNSIFIEYYRPINILTHYKCIKNRFLGRRTRFICIAFENLTIRTIMPNDGMPSMSSIAFVIGECLKGLVDIHHFDLFHGKLSAGCIFYAVNRGPAIKLAFGPSYYESDFDGVAERYMPINRIADWAGDHEDVNGEIAPLAIGKSRDTWLLGVLALELLYGKLLVESREEFMSIIAYVRRHSGLPKTWNHLKYNAIHRPSNMISSPAVASSYVSFVQYCFAPFVQRPLAENLSNHNFLALSGDLEEFHQIVVQQFGII